MLNLSFEMMRKHGVFHQLLEDKPKSYYFDLDRASILCYLEQMKDFPALHNFRFLLFLK